MTRRVLGSGAPTPWRWARAVVLLIGSALVVTLLLRSIGLDRFVEELKGARMSFVLAAGTAYLVEILVRWTRWLVLFDHPRRLPALAVWMIGTGVNELAPSGTGELVRGLVARERFGIPLARVLAPTAVERLADLLLLVGLASLALVTLAGPVPPIVVGLPVLLVAAGLAMVFRPNLLAAAGRRVGSRGGFARRIGGLLESIAAELRRQAARPAALAAAVVLTGAVWVLEALSQWWMLAALGVHVAFLAVLGFAALAFLAGFVSFLPGGLGSREAALTGLLVAAGAPAAPAATAALALRAGQTLLVLLCGAGAAIGSMVPEGPRPVRSGAPQVSSASRAASPAVPEGDGPET